nr:Ig-like domain-containing protein [Prevotella illustrans]
MVCSLSTVMFTSCSKDDDIKKKTLKFNVAKVEVTPMGTAEVTIGNGTQPFTVKSSDEKLATVTVAKNILTVTGVKEGKGTIMVTDKDKVMGTLPFMVVAPLSFDKQNVEVTVGQEVMVTVKSGAKPYTAMVKDAGTATASVKEDKVTIKGAKKGTTTVTVRDKNKKQGVISVTVK